MIRVWLRSCQRVFGTAFTHRFLWIFLLLDRRLPVEHIRPDGASVQRLQPHFGSPTVCMIHILIPVAAIACAYALFHGCGTVASGKPIGKFYSIAGPQC